jgi:hypothetical protein|tara:strand:- start:1005 stop:1373 length:369 start_codon:yes stop_codon:yes gene_type:complete
MKAPLKDNLSYSTIEKLNSFRQSKLPIKTLGILFKNAIATDLHRDTHLMRAKVYGKTFADQIYEIRFMSKAKLDTYLEGLRYIKGYQNNYIKKKLDDKDRINLANKRKLYSYASTRLKLTKN